MSIAERLIDAKCLLDQNRHEGALLSVLVAAAGSSRRRFPLGTQSIRRPKEKMGDAEAFETFMMQEMQKVGVCSVCFDGKCNSAERIMYKWLRCSLAHEAELPSQISFCSGESNTIAEIRRDPGPPERLVVTHSIILLIAEVIAKAPENGDVPESVRKLFWPN